MNSKRTFITRVAHATSQGTTTEEVWKAVSQGSESFSEVKDELGNKVLFGMLNTDRMAENLTERTKVQTDPITQAALRMVDDIFSDEHKNILKHREEIGVELGNNYGGLHFAQRELVNLAKRGPSAVSPYQSFAWFYSVNTGQIAVHNRLKGPCGTITTEACAGIDAIGLAQKEIGNGTNYMIAGAVDGTNSPFGIASMYSAHDSIGVHDNLENYAPYCSWSSGYVPGMGGAILLLQSGEVTQRSQRTVELIGCARAFQSPNRSTVLTSIVKKLLKDSGISISDIGVLYSDALGFPVNDTEERDVIIQIFGDQQPPITAPKTTYGRMYGGSSAADVALAALTLENQWIPPFANRYKEDSNKQLNLVVKNGRTLQQPFALVFSAGHGGYRSAALLKLSV